MVALSLVPPVSSETDNQSTHTLSTQNLPLPTNAMQISCDSKQTRIRRKGMFPKTAYFHTGSLESVNRSLRFRDLLKQRVRISACYSIKISTMSKFSLNM